MLDEQQEKGIADTIVTIRKGQLHKVKKTRSGTGGDPGLVGGGGDINMYILPFALVLIDVLFTPTLIICVNKRTETHVYSICCNSVPAAFFKHESKTLCLDRHIGLKAIQRRNQSISVTMLTRVSVNLSESPNSIQIQFTSLSTTPVLAQIS